MRLRLLLAIFLLALTPLAARADVASAVAAVRAKPGVLDALIDDRGNLWVVVKNDKINWDQYGIFMCQVVRPHQARVFMAHIVDVTSVGRGTKPQQWKNLSQVNCSLLP